MDTAQGTCQININRAPNTAQRYVTIGAPFFNAFQATFDPNNKVISIGLNYGGPGTVTTS